MHRPSLLQRTASAAVTGYVRHVPIERGKWRLTKVALRFLVVEVVPGIYVRVSDPSDSVGLHMLRAGTREPESMQLFRELLAPGMTIVDAGANIGEYTLVAAHDVGPSGQVHAFEPTPAAARHLRANVELNEMSNVRINEKALIDVPGQVSFHVEQDEPDTNYVMRDDAGEGRVTVDATTLDDYVSQTQLLNVDLIKMDIEGAEVMALGGATRLLSGEAAPILIVEANTACLARAGTTVGALIRLVNSYGYACYVIDSHGGASSYSNVLAVKDSHFHRCPALKRFGAMTPLAPSDTIAGPAGAARSSQALRSSRYPTAPVTTRTTTTTTQTMNATVSGQKAWPMNGNIRPA